MRFPLILASGLSLGISQAHAIDAAKQVAAARAAFLDAAATTALSQNASLILPSDDKWGALQIRGTSPRIQPKFNTVVQPATEEDVQKIVQFASQYGIPFLAVSGTHGWTKTLDTLPYGIQINMRKLNSVTLDPGATTATVGGGTLQWEANKALYAKNKQAGNLELHGKPCA